MENLKLSPKDVEAIKNVGYNLDKEALSGNFKALVKLFSEDALLMGPNSPVIKGRNELLEFIESSGMVVYEHKIDFGEIDGYNDLAFASCDYIETFQTSDTDKIKEEGTILAIFRKQPDESWLIDRWSWNSNLP